MRAVRFGVGRQRLALVGLAAAALLGCSASTPPVAEQPEPRGGDGGAPESGAGDGAIASSSACEDVMRSVDAAVATANVSPGVCASDSDCALVAPVIVCDGKVRLEECAVSLNASAALALRGALAQASPTYCGCGTGGSGQCASSKARCMDGHCKTAVAGDTGDSGVQECHLPSGVADQDAAPAVGCSGSAPGQNCLVSNGATVLPDGSVTDGTEVCQPQCSTGQYELTCKGPDLQAPAAPDAALGCQPIAGPTPADMLFYCCPCAP